MEFSLVDPSGLLDCPPNNSKNCYSNFYRDGPNDVFVKLGAHSRYSTSEGAITVPLESIIIHPNYNSRSFANDFALLKLRSPVTFTDKVRYLLQPSCLDKQLNCVFQGKDKSSETKIMENRWSLDRVTLLIQLTIMAIHSFIYPTRTNDWRVWYTFYLQIKSRCYFVYFLLSTNTLHYQRALFDI